MAVFFFFFFKNLSKAEFAIQYMLHMTIWIKFSYKLNNRNMTCTITHESPVVYNYLSVD